MTTTVPCPRCGVGGLQIEDDVWKCWGCVATLERPHRSSPKVHACRCECDNCQTLCEYISDEDDEYAGPFDAVLDALAARLPPGFGLPDAPKDWRAPAPTVAVLYRGDGTLLTVGAPLQRASAALL